MKYLYEGQKVKIIKFKAGYSWPDDSVDLHAEVKFNDGIIRTVRFARLTCVASILPFHDWQDAPSGSSWALQCSLCAVCSDSRNDRACCAKLYPNVDFTVPAMREFYG